MHKHPILITAKAAVLLGTEEQPQQGFICSLETTDDRERPTLTTDGITMTAHGLTVYVKCLAAGFCAAVEQSKTQKQLTEEELKALLYEYIAIFLKKVEGSTGLSILIVTPGSASSQN